MSQFGWPKGETRHKARESIMHYVLSFCISHANSDKSFDTRGSIHGFHSAFLEDKAQLGDLVILESVRSWSKWSIGWLRDIDENNGWPVYVIESLEDGELCNWSNVSLSYLPRTELSAHPDWQWNDRQFAFAKRWNKVCFKQKDAYMVLPTPPVFGDSYSVTIGTRTRHGFDEAKPQRSFPDWRKVTMEMMRECYDQCIQDRDTYNEVDKP